MKDINLYEKIPPLENQFSVKFLSSSQPLVKLRPHWHEHIELLFFVSGACDMVCDGNSFPVQAGDLVIVNRNQIHAFASTQPLEHFCIILYPSFLADIDASNLRFQNLIKGDDYIESCFYEIYAHKQRGDSIGKVHIKSTAYALMAHLMENYAVEPMSEDDYAMHINRLERLNVALSHIAEHYHEKISTAELAKMCFFSESHFCYFFKNAVGKSAINYINELRIDKASVLLKNTDESIAHISSSVGFPDLNYFSRMFRKYKGMSPREYRSNL